MYRPWMKTGSGSQFSDTRGRKFPRSSSRIFFPDRASVCASVPPPAPEPMMMTSYRSAMVVPPRPSDILLLGDLLRDDGERIRHDLGADRLRQAQVPAR